jgi:hypothetical protein
MKIIMRSTDPMGFGAAMREMYVHDRDKCAGEFCCIHNPSDHHMRGWPQLWRDDRKMMERTCPHGRGHPDPDDRSVERRHGCCVPSCCLPPRTEEEGS